MTHLHADGLGATLRITHAHDRIEILTSEADQTVCLLLTPAKARRVGHHLLAAADTVDGDVAA